MIGLTERDTIPGRLLNNSYLVGDRIGSGSVSEVYLARQRSLGNRSVAVKVLKKVICSSKRRSSGVHIKHFSLEAEMLHLCKSTAFAAIHDYGILDDGGVKRPFMVMEYLNGALLSQYFEQGRQLPLPVAARIVLTLGEALTELHRYKVTYRDLSPANVILEEAGPYRLSPRLFDLSHCMRAGDPDDEARLAEGRLLAGTPLYAAPELASGPGDASADVYSLAALGYTLLTGLPPVKLGRNTWEDYLAAVAQGRRLPETPLRKVHKHLPRHLEVLFEEGMAPSAQRIPSMSGFISRFALAILDSSIIDADPGDGSVSGGLVRGLLGR